MKDEDLDYAIAWCRQRARDDEEFMRDDGESGPSTFAVVAGYLEELRIRRFEGRCDTCQPRLPLEYEYATDKVPWERKGHPGAVRVSGETEWGKDVPNIGISPERLLDDGAMAFQGSFIGVYERAFAMLWDYNVNGRRGTDVLDLILGEEPIKGLIRDEVDRYLVMLTAQAIVQWLGTNCGRAFVDEAQRVGDRDCERLKEEAKFLRKLSSDL